MFQVQGGHRSRSVLALVRPEVFEVFDHSVLVVVAGVFLNGKGVKFEKNIRRGWSRIEMDPAKHLEDGVRIARRR